MDREDFDICFGYESPELEKLYGCNRNKLKTESLENRN